MNPKPSRLLLLDTASLYFRAYHGIPDSLRSPTGQPVNAIRGLLDFLTTLISQYQPTHLACCWDNDWRPEWRVRLIPEYKQHRVRAGSSITDSTEEEIPEDLKPQIPIIKEVLDAFGIPVIGVDGYEADDVIGTLTSTTDFPVDIVTGDRDLFQLVDDAAAVRVLYTARGVRKHEVITGAVVRDRYAVTPEQYVDFAVLRGDPSDGLPGVKGIGDKTAARLLNDYQSLDQIQLAAAEPGTNLSPALRANLLAAQSYLAVAPRVVRVSSDIGLELPDLGLGAAPKSPEALNALSKLWGLGSSVDRLREALASQ